MQYSISNLKNTSIAALCSTLIACGGSGNGVQTGVFLDSAVEGLHYETTSQSGLTNDAGEFTYKEGETVTFSVGGITLGSVSGSAQVTPFDLFQLAVPTTEAEVLAILRSVSEVNDYDRVINIAVFLTSLDQDGNPENGIDLTGWEAALSNASLSFDHNKNSFSFKEFNPFVKQFGIKQQKSLATALTHVIGSLNINIPVSLVTKIEVDTGNDGSINEVTNQHYDTNGRSTNRQFDSDNDGNFEQISNITFNAQGLVTQIEGLFDFDGFGGQDITNSNTSNNTYDVNGNQTGSVQNTDFDGDGDIDERITTTFNYDDKDNNIRKTTLRATVNPVLGDVLESSEVETRTFDNAGRELTFRLEIDSPVDDVVDTILTTTKAFNTGGELTSMTRNRDNDADGTPETTEVTTLTYDTNGNKLTELRELDNTTSNDGPDDITSRVFTYNANNQILTEALELTSLDVDITRPYRKRVKTFFYNSKNQQVRIFEEVDSDNDGTVDRTFLDEFEYNDFGLVSKKNRTTDGSPLIDGFSSKSSNTRTFDSDGNQLTNAFEKDSNGDGDIDLTSMQTFVFVDGRQQSSLFEEDTNNDGISETSIKTTFSYTVFSGGLLGLILQNILL